MNVTINSLTHKTKSLIAVNATADIHYKILNLSGTALTKERFDLEASIAKGRIDDILSGDARTVFGDWVSSGKGVGKMNRYEMTGNVDVHFSMEQVSSIKDIKKGDYAILLVDQLSESDDGAVGHGDLGGNLIMLDVNYFLRRADNWNLIAHEVGHNIGLAHEKDEANFMYAYNSKKSIKSTSEQRGYLLYGIGINNKTKKESFQFSKDYDTKKAVFNYIANLNKKGKRHD
ncbi:reprolysin-like metallopeptidase [Chitinophaga costaii]|uniref:reprolysin-like metallopeptidase n=1 Tax=Chitinophaga costaii TaxID=1335309 RepID=UPI003742313B